MKRNKGKEEIGVEMEAEVEVGGVGSSGREGVFDVQ